MSAAAMLQPTRLQPAAATSAPLQSRRQFRARMQQPRPGHVAASAPEVATFRTEPFPLHFLSIRLKQQVLALSRWALYLLESRACCIQDAASATEAPAAAGPTRCRTCGIELSQAPRK